jgi:hypothetical protein
MNRIPTGSGRPESGRTYTSQGRKSGSIGGALRRVMVVLGSVALAGSIFSIYAGTSSAANPTTPTQVAPFNECPGVGADSSCQFLIILNANGTTTILQDKTQGPYDGEDDTLVGVLNLTTGAVPLINLSSNTDIFNFDGDGICGTDRGHHFMWVGSGANGGGFTASTGFTGCPYGPKTYEGPWVSFSNYGSANNWETGTVNFSVPGTSGPTGLPAQASTFFSLESDLSGATFTAPPTTTTTSSSTTTTKPTTTTTTLATTTTTQATTTTTQATTTTTQATTTTTQATTTTTQPTTTTTASTGSTTTLPPPPSVTVPSTVATTTTTIPAGTSTTAAPTTTAPTVPTTAIPSSPPTVPPTAPPATVPSGAPGTGVGGAATSSDNGVLLVGSGIALFAGLAGLALIARRRRSA